MRRFKSSAFEVALVLPLTEILLVDHRHWWDGWPVYHFMTLHSLLSSCSNHSSRSLFCVFMNLTSPIASSLVTLYFCWWSFEEREPPPAADVFGLWILHSISITWHVLFLKETEMGEMTYIIARVILLIRYQILNGMCRCFPCHICTDEVQKSHEVVMRVCSWRINWSHRLLSPFLSLIAFCYSFDMLASWKRKILRRCAQRWGRLGQLDEGIL